MKNKAKYIILTTSFVLFGFFLLFIYCGNKNNSQSAGGVVDNKALHNNGISIHEGQDAELKEEISTSSIKMVFVGDIMLGRYVDKRIKSYDLKLGSNNAPFIDNKLRDIIGNADIAVGNLESPLTNTGEHDNLGIEFNADAKYTSRLSSVGFDILGTANNHAVDMGKRGVESTVKALYSNGILGIGTNSGLGSEGSGVYDCHAGVVKEVRGVRVGVLAYSYTEYNDGGESPGNDVCDWGDFERVKTDLVKLKEKADYVIIMAHTGVENSSEPTIKDQEKFKSLIDSGAAAVIGHHPHVVQRVEEYKSGVIAYSLGNFVFDQIEPEQKVSEILEIQINSDGVLSYKTIPVKIEDLCCPKL